jgi:hypothetical protein
MNRAKTNRSEDEHARIETEIGNILAGEEELLPSSGFAASVMDRVRQEAALPAPPPFPWLKAVLVILLASSVFGWGAIELVHLGVTGLSLSAMNRLTILPLHLSADLVHMLEETGWVALALGSSLVSWLISRRLAGRGGLL